MEIVRREFLKHIMNAGLAASIPASFWLSGCEKKSPAAKPTNIILISIDTLRADHLGCYGYQRPTSPALDKLASRSLLFEDVSAPSPWTMPSHASLLTGLYPSHNGARSRHNRLSYDVVTLAEVFKQNDFRTAAIVNSHWLGRKNGLHRGFENFTHLEEDATRRMPSEVGDEAYKWLSKNSHQPFFLFLHYYDVHSDYASLPEYEKLFLRPYDGNADGTTKQLLSIRNHETTLNQTDTQHLIDLYDAGIRQMDDGLDQLVTFLERKSLLDNTLIVITSDHGEEFLDHGGVLHGLTYYQEILHVPLIIHGPGLPQPKRIKHMASLVDIMPTILSLAGISKPLALDGIELNRLWQNGGKEPPQRYIFAEADWNNRVGNRIVDDIKRSVRNSRYKLQYDLVTKEFELYDLLQDPMEKVNIASENSSLQNSLFGQLENFMRINKTGQPAESLSADEIKRLKSLGYMQ